jgi:hypothetical protein
MKIRLVSRIFLWFLVCFLGTTQVVPAQAIRTQVEVDSTALLIGNQLQFRITVDHPAGQSIVLPGYKSGDTLGGLEILKVDSLQASGEGGFLRLEQALTLTAFDSGYFQIPPQSVLSFPKGDTSQPSLSQTNPLLIRFDFPADVDTTQAYKEIKDIQNLPLSFQDIWPWLVGAVLVILVIGLPIFLILYRRAKPTAFKRPPPPPVPAHEKAMRRLAQLEKEKYWQKGEYQTYYFELSYILRAYLEDRYGILALESTTDDILRDLKDRIKNLKQQSLLRDLLQLAELAKFAKFEPTAQENLGSMDTARNFVKATRVQKEKADTSVAKENDTVKPTEEEDEQNLD